MKKKKLFIFILTSLFKRHRISSQRFDLFVFLTFGTHFQSFSSHLFVISDIFYLPSFMSFALKILDLKLISSPQIQFPSQTQRFAKKRSSRRSLPCKVSHTGTRFQCHPKDPQPCCNNHPRSGAGDVTVVHLTPHLMRMTTMTHPSPRLRSCTRNNR